MFVGSDFVGMAMEGGGGGGLQDVLASVLTILFMSFISAFVSLIFSTTKSGVSRSAFVPDVEIT